MASTQQDSILLPEETTPKDQAAPQKDANSNNTYDMQAMQRAYYFGGEAEDNTAKTATVGGAKHFTEACEAESPSI